MQVLVSPVASREEAKDVDAGVLPPENQDRRLDLSASARVAAKLVAEACADPQISRIGDKAATIISPQLP